MTPDEKSLRSAAATAHQSGDLAKAASLYALFLTAVPTDATMWSNLGALHRTAARHKQALRAHERAFDLAPHDTNVLNNYANILSDVGRYDESIAVRRTILAKDPANANHLAMIGRCLRGKGDYNAAIAHLQAAIPDFPDDTELVMQLAFAQLAARDYVAGFKNYRVRWQAGELTPRNLPFPEWQGEPLAGKTVLVLPEQGFGDAILFARFVKVLKAMDAIVHYLAERPVARLFEQLEGADWVGGHVSKTAKYDYWINCMDLAPLYFASSDVVPPPMTLHVPDTSVTRATALTARYRDVFRVGVVWTGSTTYKGNAFRSFSHTDFLPLTGIKGVQLFSLYKGPALDAYHADGSSAFIIDAGSTETDFADCAAMMQQMDLVITSDTATAHLAGSLGVPTWTILHWDAFWVWRHQGDTTDWYPQMRLFRQHAPLAWDGVLHDVAQALEKQIGNAV